MTGAERPAREGPTLVCGATGTEAGACRAGIADAGVGGVEVLETGVGPDRAAAALARRLAAGPRPRLVVSAGFAGALTDGVAPFAWITASSLHRAGARGVIEVPLAPGLLRVAPGALASAVVTGETVLGPELLGAVAGLASAPDRSSGAPPVVGDMESAALAEIAGAAGVPVLVLRLVTDTPARPLPRVARTLASALSSRSATAAARAAIEAALAPRAAVGLVRAGLDWRARLRAGMRDHARAGVFGR